jgi:protein-disulfide isomerase
MKRVVAVIAVASLTLLAGTPGFGQQAQTDVKKELEAIKEAQAKMRSDLELKKELDALKEGQAKLRAELAEIKALLQARPAAAPGQAPAAPTIASLSVDGAPMKGNKNAQVTLVEFTDYQCPFCGRHVRETWPQIEKDYVAKGKVKFVVREFPLESLHKNAFKAAEAAQCAAEQGKYFEMHDRLFANQNALETAQLPEHAAAIGLNAQKFKECMDSGKYAAQVRKDLAEGAKLGVTGTPTFFVGLTDPKDPKTVKSIRVIKGAQGYSAFQGTIDELLSQQN